jgi:hypothetical protein
MYWLQKIAYSICVSCRPHKSHTVRLAFPVLLISVALLGAAVATSENVSYVTLEANKTLIQAGEKVAVDITVFAHAPVNAIDFKISYPSSQLEVTGIDAGESVITLWTQEPYFEDNTVYLQGGTYRRGFTGKHFIARINAVAKKTGSAEILVEEVRLLAGDGSGTEIKTSTKKNETSVVVNVSAEGTLQSDIKVIQAITDLDGDGEVSLRDISVFMAAWRSRDVLYDFSGDGKMTFRDFGIILADSFLK